MSHGPKGVFVATIATGGSLSTSTDLSRAWPQMWLGIPTMSAYIVTATCNVFVKGSGDGTIFYDVMQPVVNSSTSAINTFVVANSVSGCMVPIPGGYRYLKVQVGNTATAAVAFQIICGGD